MGVALINGHLVSDSGVNLSAKADLVNGLVPSSQLPSFVDDVLEYANLAAFPVSGETSKIYVALDTNRIYRWSGSAYIEISPTVGTTWGGISGTLSNQTDLQTALNNKQNTLNGTGYLKMSGTTLTYVGLIPNADLVNSSVTIQGVSVGLGSSMNVINGTGFVRASGTTISYLSGTSSQFVKADGSLDSTTYTSNTGTVTSVTVATGSTGTDINVSGSSVTTSGTITLNIPTASGTARGLLSFSDWTIFNNKQTQLNGTGYTKMSGTTVSYIASIPNSDLTNSSITVQGTAVSLGGSVNIINGTGFVKASGSTVSYDNSTYLTTAANWFGAVETGGTLDWNHVSNTRPGTGYTLLLGSATNGFGLGKYYHAFNLEYASKDGSGQITQLALSYATDGNDLRMRGRYSGTWTSWVTFWNTANLSVSGTTNYIAKFTAGTSLGNSQIFDNGTNVGIGTTSPDQKLEVNGNIKLTSGGFLYGNGSSAYLQLTDANGSRLAYSNGVYLEAKAASVNIKATTEAVSIFNNTGSINLSAAGDIGVGTTTPTNYTNFRSIDLRGRTNSHGGIFQSATLDGSVVGLVYIAGSAFNVETGTSHPIYLKTGNTARVVIDTAGNVGFGTTSPAYKIHLPEVVNAPDQAMIAGVVFGSDGNGQTITPSGSRALSIVGQAGYGKLYTGVFGGVGKWGINTTMVNASVLNLNGNMTIGEGYQGVSAPTNGLLVEGSVLVYGSLTVGSGGAIVSYIPYNIQTSSYTLALTDVSKIVEINSGSAVNVTVPLNSAVAFPIGTQITVGGYGTGQVSFVGSSGVVIRSAGNRLKLTQQYSFATLTKRGTDEWHLFGDLTV